MHPFTDEQITEFLDGKMDLFADGLSELVRIPSISARPEHEADLDKVVANLQRTFSGLNFQTHKLEARAGNRRYPALLATYEVDPAAPWVLIYNHADVQPEMDIAKWKGEAPFSGRIDREQGIVYGRGATDDKGPLLGTLHALLFLIQNKLLPVNVEWIIETAEESGSVGFEEMAEKEIETGLIKKPSHVFVSDTEFKEGHPNLLGSLRGLIDFHLSLTYAQGSMHSGIFGDVVPGALEILSDVLAHTVKNPYTGRIKIPGFYDGVQEPTPEQMRVLRHAATYLSADGFRAASKAHVLRTDDSLDVLARTGLKPSASIHTYIGGVVSTGIAPSAEAYVTLRLVDGQDPTRIKRLFLDAIDAYFKHQTGRTENNMTHLYGGVAEVNRELDLTDTEDKRLIFPGVPGRIEVEIGHTVPAFKTSVDTPYHTNALGAYARFFDTEPMILFEGGTIGTLPILQRAFGKETPFVLFAQSRDDDGYHQEGEHYRLDHARKGIAAVAHYFASLRDVENR